MATFLTEYKNHLGQKWCGPNITAPNIIDAKKQIKSLKIIGVLVETIGTETGERTLFGEDENEK